MLRGADLGFSIGDDGPPKMFKNCMNVTRS